MGSVVNPSFLRKGYTQLWESTSYSKYFKFFLKKFLSIFLFLKGVLKSRHIYVVGFKLLSTSVNSFTLLLDFLKVNKLEFYLDQATGRFTKGSRAYNTRIAKKKKQKKKSWKKNRKKKLLLSLSFNLKERLVVQKYFFRITQLFQKKTAYKLYIKFNNVFNNTLFYKMVKDVFLLNKGPFFLKYYDFYEDLIRVVGATFFFFKSDILSTYISILVHRHRDLLKHLKHIKSITALYYSGVFKNKVSLKIGVFGKLRGQKSRRFRRYIISYGRFFPNQSMKHNLSYSLIKTYNIYGSFGIKVWLFYMSRY